MKILLVTCGACAAALAIAVAAQTQNRGGDFGGGFASRIAIALDADRDGTISASELRGAAAALKTLDANGDGRLTPDELRPSFGARRGGDGRFGRGPERPDGPGERGGGAGATADDLTDTLMAFDRNGDGSLVRAEVPERFQGLFDRADANKDGALSREELKQSAGTTAPNDEGRGRGGRGRGGAMFDPVIRALDTDRGGSLSEAEIAAAPGVLAALDANGDGLLSRDEYRPAPGRGREGRQ
jgi:Ca2+-binding EF-hand superfamily protein